MGFEPPWYHEGLRFKCTGCGQCCTGSPGYVWISDEEIQKASAYLGISCEEFIQKYTCLYNGRRSLTEVGKQYDCIFLKDRKCTIYPVRPQQCRTFPWWREYLETPQTWKEAAERCEGINHPESPLISLPEIEKNFD